MKISAVVGAADATWGLNDIGSDPFVLEKVIATSIDPPPKGTMDR